MKTINEVYAGKSWSEITDGLRIAGGLAEQARIGGKSLSTDDRIFLSDLREAANKIGMSRQMQNATEEEGAALVREALS